MIFAMPRNKIDSIDTEEGKRILQMIADRKVSPEEGQRLLIALGEKETNKSNKQSGEATGTSSPIWKDLQNLRKSSKDCLVGGVCGGLGEHSPIPAWIWRTFFLVLILCFGTGLLAYIILWICMPGALKSEAQTLLKQDTNNAPGPVVAKRQKIASYLVIVAVIGLLGVAWVFYCSAGVLDKNPDRAALKIAKLYGGFDESEMSVSAAPSVFSKEKGFPMSVLAEQKIITFDVHRKDTSGKLYVHLYKWTGFGWKLLHYENATYKTTSKVSQANGN